MIKKLSAQEIKQSSLINKRWGESPDQLKKKVCSERTLQVLILRKPLCRRDNLMISPHFQSQAAFQFISQDTHRIWVLGLSPMLHTWTPICQNKLCAVGRPSPILTCFWAELGCSTKTEVSLWQWATDIAFQILSALQEDPNRWDFNSPFCSHHLSLISSSDACQPIKHYRWLSVLYP